MKLLMTCGVVMLLLTSNLQAFAIQQDTTKLTKEVVYRDVKDVLKQLGETLKVGSEHVYSVLVRQQVVNSIIWLVLALLSVIMLWFCFINAKKCEFNHHGDSINHTEINLTSSITFGILGVLTAIISLFHIDIIVTGFANPEYGAIVKIIDLLKPNR